MTAAAEPCQFLAWDSEFFGRRIARVEGHRLDPQRVEAVLQWCVTQQIDCLYFLADSDHTETVRLAEDNGFRFLDIRVTLAHTLKAGVARGADESEFESVRTARDQDVPELQAIARVIYRNTRYYYDPCFPDERCDDLYATWIQRSCEGYADRVFVVESDLRPIGYISCHLSSDKMKGTIGLVGIAPEAQGRGLGPVLVRRSLDWFAEQSVQSVDVVTQGRNVAAQRLYQRCGFQTNSLQLWYHKWFVDCG